MGEKGSVLATVYTHGNEGISVTWTSSDPSVATVESTPSNQYGGLVEGIVTGVKEGFVTITVTAKAPKGIGKSASCKVRIIDPSLHIKASSLTLNKSIDSLDIGQTDTLTAKVAPDNTANKTVKWTSSDPSVASVDSEGKVTALKEGSAQITATTTDGSNLSSSCWITVNDHSKYNKVLTIKLISDGEKKVYTLSNEELTSFLNWYDAISRGIGPAYYFIENKSSGGTDYIPFDKIEYFNVNEYKAA